MGIVADIVKRLASPARLPETSVAVGYTGSEYGVLAGKRDGELEERHGRVLVALLDLEVARVVVAVVPRRRVLVGRLLAAAGLLLSEMMRARAHGLNTSTECSALSTEPHAESPAGGQVDGTRTEVGESMRWGGNCNAFSACGARGRQ